VRDDIEVARRRRGRYSQQFLAFDVIIICAPIVSGLFVISLCSLMIIRMSPESASLLKIFPVRKFSVYLVDFVLRGMVFVN
jgi:hypothetical protein